MEGREEEGVVDLVIVVDGVNERAEIVLFDWFHLVFAMIDRPPDPVGFIVVHGVAHGEPAHQVGNAGFERADILAENQVEAIWQKEEAKEGDGGGAELGGVPLGDHRLGTQAFDPGERSSVGEAEVVGEEENQVLVVSVALE